MTTPWGSPPPEQPGWGGQPPGHPPPGPSYPGQQQPPQGRGRGLLIGVIVLLLVLIAGVGTGIGLLVTRHSSSQATPVAAAVPTVPSAPPLPGGDSGSAGPTPVGSPPSGSPAPATSSAAPATSSAAPAYDPVLEGRPITTSYQLAGSDQTVQLEPGMVAAMQQLDKLAAAGDVAGIAAIVGKHPNVSDDTLPTAADVTALLKTPGDLVAFRKTLRVHPDGQDCAAGFPGLLSAGGSKTPAESAQFTGDLRYLRFSAAQIAAVQAPGGKTPPIIQLVLSQGPGCGDNAIPAGQVLELMRTR